MTQNAKPRFAAQCAYANSLPETPADVRVYIVKTERFFYGDGGEKVYTYAVKRGRKILGVVREMAPLNQNGDEIMDAKPYFDPAIGSPSRSKPVIIDYVIQRVEYLHQAVQIVMAHA